MKKSGSPERASIDELRALQLERLQWAVHHAYRNVEHYRRSFESRGVHPDELRTLEDLARFPFLWKQDFRDNYPFGLFAVPREKVARVHASSGTTGRPTVVESTLGLDAVDIYGLSEVMGPGVASECVETKDGPVIWEDHFYPEIIDPDTGEVRAEGEEGELVLTSLTKEALPVIRYRTRDLTRLLPPTSRSMRRMARIAGRTDDMLIVRGVNVFPSQIEELILRTAGLSPHYWLEMARAGHLDTLTVHVECGADSSDDDSRSRAARELANQAKSLIGISIGVEVHVLGTIERSVGKAKRVYDRRRP